jgi:hypothetical protein
MQASLFDGFTFDGVRPLENRWSSTEVDVGAPQIVQALVISPIVVVVDELADT